MRTNTRVWKLWYRLHRSCTRLPRCFLFCIIFFFFWKTDTPLSSSSLTVKSKMSERIVRHSGIMKIMFHKWCSTIYKRRIHHEPHSLGGRGEALAWHTNRTMLDWPITLYEENTFLLLIYVGRQPHQISVRKLLDSLYAWDKYCRLLLHLKIASLTYRI
jgi:hypothetical protein